MVYEMNTCIANSLKSLLLCNLWLMVKRFSFLINSEIYSGKYVFPFPFTITHFK